MSFQLFIRVPDDGGSFGVRVGENQYCMNTINADHGTGAYFAEGVQYPFNIVRVHIQSFRCDDQIFFPPAKIQVTLGVDLSKVAGMQPLSLGGHTFTTNQNFAITCNSDVLTWNHFAERSVL